MSPSSMSGVRPMTLKADSGSYISVFTLEEKMNISRSQGRDFLTP